jgi:serine-type D-Ala-D-Ala carboxypeptidase/endopeptidase (penicillin-binding protein 4)
MPHRLIAFILAVLIIGCTGSRELPRTTNSTRPPFFSPLSVSPYPVLKGHIDAFIADTLFPPSNIGIKVVSLTRGEPLYALNEGMLFNPASNEKLITSATTLSTLGPWYDFSTVVLIDTTRRLVVLRGEGDPLTSTNDLDSLARSVAPLLPGTTPWRVVVDVSFFDDEYWGAGWTWDEEPEAYGMFISPITLNNNTITVKVQPAAAVGKPPIVTCDPPTAYVTVENSAVTVADSPSVHLKISRKWKEHSNILTVDGQIRFKARPRTEQLSLWKPELYAGTVFAECLEAHGVPTVKPVTVDSLRLGMIELVRFRRGIDTVMTFVNKVSDNLGAECLLKTIAARKGSVPGSAGAAIPHVYEYLSSCGVDTNRIAVADGSGLSRYNLTSSATIVKLLENIYRNDRAFPVLYHALPIAGVDGTIGSRMKGTTAEGNLRAKTGSLSAVSALSGYVRTQDDEMLAFSILMQNFPGATRPYRLVQDSIGVYLSGLRRADFE